MIWRNLKASLALLIVGTGLVALYPGHGSASAESSANRPRIVVEFRSQAGGELRDIDGTMMMCFDGVYVDLATDRVVGTGSDCLDLASIEGGNPFAGESFVISNTTIFNLNGGTITTSQRTTIAPVVQGDTGEEETVATHITGDLSRGVILSGTGRFQNATGAVRLHGAVDMSQFDGTEGSPIGFNCVFMLDLD